MASGAVKSSFLAALGMTNNKNNSADEGRPRFALELDFGLFQVLEHFFEDWSS